MPTRPLPTIAVPVRIHPLRSNLKMPLFPLTLLLRLSPSKLKCRHPSLLPLKSHRQDNKRLIPGSRMVLLRSPLLLLLRVFSTR
ncbi:hypothetical protein C366_01867 [Cryptococcus neoformans Tu401-1]|nr:hypothetical protein C366_01867 [Cryptococcus neoformans var. grubii Tu401-1]